MKMTIERIYSNRNFYNEITIVMEISIVTLL